MKTSIKPVFRICRISHLISRGHLLLVVTIFLGLAAIFQQAAATGTPFAKEYRVEMVFFTYDNPENLAEEQWPQTVTPPDRQGDLNLFGGASAPGYRPLPSSSFRLNDAVRRLEANGRYTVIGHIAWIQPGVGIDQARPIYIDLGKNYAPLYPQQADSREQLSQLSGTVKVVLGRYLHVYTHLILRVPVIPADNDVTSKNKSLHGASMKQSAGTDSNALPRHASLQWRLDLPVLRGTALPSAASRLLAIPIDEQRRTRSKVLNYIDHPMLGILFEIWPVKADGSSSTSSYH